MKFIPDGRGRVINPALVQYFFVHGVPRKDEDIAVTARFFLSVTNSGQCATHDVDLAYFKTRDEAEAYLSELVAKLNAEATK